MLDQQADGAQALCCVGVAVLSPGKRRGGALLGVGVRKRRGVERRDLEVCGKVEVGRDSVVDRQVM